MKISRVRFGAFKSLYDVECALEQLTVLTGPNGSGKSNFVEAIQFVGETYTHGLEFALSRAGGFENVAFRKTRRAQRAVSFYVELTFDAQDIESILDYNDRRVRRKPKSSDRRKGLVTYTHHFSFRTRGQSLRADYSVVDDRIAVTTSEGGRFELTKNDSGQLEPRLSAISQRDSEHLEALVYPFSDPEYRKLGLPKRLATTSLLSELFFYPNLLTNASNALQEIKLFQLSPFESRKSGVPTPNAILERHGDNLPGAADFLKRRDPAAWHSVENMMRAIMPGLESIEIAYTTDRRLAIQFHEAGLGRPWTTDEVSDGTVQALALYIGLFDKRTPTVVIEEPENALHPWILRQFLDVCRESRKQVILTTHSPVVLNYVSPSIVNLVYLLSGRSQVSPLLKLAPELREGIMSGELNLFDAYDSGAVVEGLPRGFRHDDGEHE